MSIFSKVISDHIEQKLHCDLNNNEETPENLVEAGIEVQKVTL